MMRKVERSCRAHPEQDRAECARMVDELVRKFLGAGLLNDGQYAEAMVSTLRRRGLSSRAIQARLAARGVEAAHVRAALLGVEGEDDDLQAAVRLARRKRLGPFGVKDPGGEKDMAAFARAGFGYSIARRVLEMSAEEAEEISKQ